MNRRVRNEKKFIKTKKRTETCQFSKNKKKEYILIKRKIKKETTKFTSFY